MVREYIGARYVPKFMGAYDVTQAYEALCVVDNGLGTSYISKVPTPAGTPLTNTAYWAVYGSVSGAVINLQDQIDSINTNLGKIIGDDITLDGLLTLSGSNYSLNDSTISGAGNGDNVELNNGNLSGVTYSVNCPEGLDVEGSAKITENDIINAGATGINVNQSPANNIIVSDNNIEALDYSVLINQNASGKNFLIDGNIIKSDNGDGVEVNNPSGLHKNTVVTSNIISAGADGGSGTSSGFSIGMSHANNISVTGNVSEHSRIAGLHIENNVNGAVVSSNVFDNCQSDGAWIDQGYSDISGTSGDPVVHSSNIYKGNSTDVGLRMIYDADSDDSVIFDNGNIYNKFDTGITSGGNIANQHFRKFDDLITTCTTGIVSRTDIHGKLIIDKCTNGIVVDLANNPIIIDDVNFLHAPDADKIIKFNQAGSSAIIKHLFLEKALANGTSFQLMPEPAYAKGKIIVRGYSGYSPFKIYEIDGTTLTQIYTHPYGSVTVSLAINNGYLELVTNTTFNGIVTIDFEGDYVINS